MTRPEQIAWAVGLFEGEGSIGVQEQGGRIRMRFQLASTDEDVVRRFHEIVAVGHVRGPVRVGEYKPQWIWTATSRSDVTELSEMFSPLLGERRQNALERAWHQFSTQPEPRRHKAEKTHCPHGHALTEENVLRPASQPVRRCRECERQRSFRKNRGLDASSSVPDRAYSKNVRRRMEALEEVAA